MSVESTSITGRAAQLSLQFQQHFIHNIVVAHQVEPRALVVQALFDT